MNAYYYYTPTGYNLAFAYDPVLVEVLKDVVPSSSRRWNPGAREWHIAIHAWDDLVDVFEMNGVEFTDITEKMEEIQQKTGRTVHTPQREQELERRIADVEERERALKEKERQYAIEVLTLMQQKADFAARNKSTSSTPEEYRLLYVTPDAPMAVLDAARRALVKLNHPDVGGSNDKMARINAAFDKIKSWR